MITADKVFKGSTEIIRIYKGTTLEWEKSVPIPDADAYIKMAQCFNQMVLKKEIVLLLGLIEKARRNLFFIML